MNMEMDLNHSHPSTAPPPYPGPPDSSRQPFVSNNPGPQSSYTRYPNQPSVTVVHSPPVGTGVQHIVITNTMGPNSAPYTCQSCNIQIITRTERKPTLRTHLCAGLLCILALWPCVIIPYCMDTCNNIDHYCPNCSAYIGTYMA